MTQSKNRGLDDDEDDTSVIEIEEYDDESDGGVYPRIKQEAIKVEDMPEDGDEDNPPVENELLVVIKRSITRY